jgi:molybdopterin molybdotransferase
MSTTRSSTQRPPPLLTLDEALARLMAAVRPFDVHLAESVATFDALGRVLAESVRSALDVPPAGIRWEMGNSVPADATSAQRSA